MKWTATAVWRAQPFWSASRLRWCVMALLAWCSMGMDAVRAAETPVVVVGRTQACFSRDYALELAAIAAENNANEACTAMGSGWRLGELRIPGYQQCKQCGTSGEYRCEITQVSYSCISRDGAAAKPEKEEKPPKDAKSGKAEKLDKTDPNRRGKGSSAGTESASPGSAALEGLYKPPSGEEKGAAAARNPLEQFEVQRAEMLKQPIRITSPQPRQQVMARVVDVVGNTQGVLRNVELTVHFNGTQQRITSDASGKFQVRLVTAAGPNTVKVCHAQACSEVSIDARIQPQALMATLTWQGRADLDLHVLTPSGAHCMHSRRSIANECSLDIDDVRGVNPENISIPPTSPKGNYRFSVVNYSGQPDIPGVLTVYKDERLVETRRFVTAGGQKSTALEISIGNE
ncbi:hypothetical protein G7048_10515 [Diaphorobacter sp. HDW4B]|uniref:YfaP family protein n=1 Tax=Diaphorobacter sp. HDW4B TaxID=2714925 RepID=UPI00140D782C|nr:hypothetical protein [Diaphorobacter sp. HDW4B]QIL70757.1 hypothetical protein G7048_10515 [Diaphorobacter sp. HDW4B]